MLIIDNILTTEELKQLDQGLLRHRGISIFQLHGLICAIASGPHPKSCTAWLALIWGSDLEFNQDNKNNKNNEIISLMELIMRLYQNVNTMLLQDQQIFPLIDYAEVSSLSTHKLTDTQKLNLHLWCEGYMRGVGFDMDEWIELAGTEISVMLMPIYLISRKNLNELEKSFDQKPVEKNIIQHIKNIVEVLPKLITSINKFWRLLQANQLEQAPQCSCRMQKRFAQFYKNMLH